MSIEDVETTQWETSDIRLQTIRQAMRLEAEAPLVAGGMAVGDFSTALEMTVSSPDNQPVRFQTSDGEKKRPVNICCLGAIQYGSERHRVHNREPVNMREGAGSFRCMTSS